MPTFSRIFLSLALLGLLTPLHVAHAGEVLIDEEVSKLLLGTKLHYLRDETDQVELEDFLERYREDSLKRGEIDVPKFGVSGQGVAFWFHLKLLPELTRSKSFVLLAEPAYLRYIDVYFLDENGDVVERLNIGQHRPSANRPIYHHAFPIRITLDKKPLSPQQPGHVLANRTVSL